MRPRLILRRHTSVLGVMSVITGLVTLGLELTRLISLNISVEAVEEPMPRANMIALFTFLFATAALGACSCISCCIDVHNSLQIPRMRDNVNAEGFDDNDDNDDNDESDDENHERFNNANYVINIDNANNEIADANNFLIEGLNSLTYNPYEIALLEENEIEILQKMINDDQHKNLKNDLQESLDNYLENSYCGISLVEAVKPVTVYGVYPSLQNQPTRSWVKTYDVEILKKFIVQCTTNQEIAFAPNSPDDLLNDERVTFKSGYSDAIKSFVTKARSIVENYLDNNSRSDKNKIRGDYKHYYNRQMNFFSHELKAKVAELQEPLLTMRNA